MVVTIVLMLSALSSGHAAQDPPAFSFDRLRAIATERARAPAAPEDSADLPEWLAKLDYEGYRSLRFRPETSLWTDDNLPFRIRFMHRGYLYGRRVPIHVVDGAKVEELRFSPAQFEYPEGSPPVPDELGYSGFAVLSWSDTTQRWDEIAAFQGASYFRLLGDGQVYGASLRGLTIDTAATNGEEFPAFVEFWIERPLPGATRLTVYALLDSPGASGAYRFLIGRQGPEVEAEVSVCIVPRHPIGKLGLAPLTTMFLSGEDGLRRQADYRPEIHDSDGLLLANGDGAWTWRPLANPDRTHRIERFPLENPAGFGLLQRDRAFASYEDLGARFELRPGFWVSPRGAWGKGAVELIEIPTSAEWNENVVAYWVPEAPVTPGEPLCLDYGLTTTRDDAQRPPLARCTALRLRPGDKPFFVLDFAGPQLEGDFPSLHADITAKGASIGNVVLQPNEAAGGVRLTFELAARTEDRVDLRVRLLRGERAVSETVAWPWVKP